MQSSPYPSLAINHANGSVNLSLPLSQPLPENALNMTKFNTVLTSMSDITCDMGNIVTEMVTWGTSAVIILCMLCQLRLLSNFNYIPLYCHYGMLVSSAKVIVLLTIHLVFHSLPFFQPFESHHLVGSHQLHGVMKVTSTILCHCVHTISCSIVRLCSGVLLLSKQLPLLICRMHSLILLQLS